MVVYIVYHTRYEGLYVYRILYTVTCLPVQYHSEYNHAPCTMPPCLLFKAKYLLNALNTYIRQDFAPYLASLASFLLFGTVPLTGEATLLK
jgi:hypothetical protein